MSAHYNLREPAVEVLIQPILFGVILAA